MSAQAKVLSNNKICQKIQSYQLWYAKLLVQNCGGLRHMPLRHNIGMPKCQSAMTVHKEVLQTPACYWLKGVSSSYRKDAVLEMSGLGGYLILLNCLAWEMVLNVPVVRHSISLHLEMLSDFHNNILARLWCVSFPSLTITVPYPLKMTQLYKRITNPPRNCWYEFWCKVYTSFTSVCLWAIFKLSNRAVAAMERFHLLEGLLDCLRLSNIILAKPADMRNCNTIWGDQDRAQPNRNSALAHYFINKEVQSVTSADQQPILEYLVERSCLQA